MADGAEDLLAAVGEPVTFNGVSVLAVVQPISSEYAVEFDGRVCARTGELLVHASRWPLEGDPCPHMRLVVRGRRLSSLAVEQLAGGIWRVEMGRG